jgi:hypothetical protein
LTGKYFVYPLIGTTLIGGINYEKFNKYGFGVVPATTVINNYDNE